MPGRSGEAPRRARDEAGSVPLPRGSSALGPTQRVSALAQLKGAGRDDPLDVLVIGGGVVGCGAALDAASRGLRVGLVEAEDLAAGTSSRSSRLAHGGLRYLEQLEFGLVHEALTERGLLLDRLAPHLVRPLPFLLPVTRVWEKSYLGAGVALYDALSRLGAYGGLMPRPRQLSRAAVHGLAPGLRIDGLAGAVRFHDAQIDDARHTVAVARTAAAFGAAIGTQLQVTDLLLRSGRIVGASVRDVSEGGLFDVHARVVVAAVGVWTDEMLRLCDRALARSGADTGPRTSGARVRQSKGVHLVVPRAAFSCSLAVIARTPVSVLFLLPWSEHWLIGTTDTDDEGPLDRPTVTATDVDYLLGQANRWLAQPLSHSDVVGVYAGLRPLVSAHAGAPTASLSREHLVIRPAPGMVAIAGGKYTTYRVMAEDVVDAAALELPGPIGPSRTAGIPLVGAVGFRQAWAHRVRTARAAGMPVESIERLLQRHGDRIGEVLDLVADSPDLAGRLHPRGRVIRAEALIAVRDEGARSLADILIRRTRLAMQTADRAAAAARPTAELVAPLLGWDEARIAQEIAILADSQPAVPAG